MRLFVATLAVLALTSCASRPEEDHRFQVGAAESGYVIIGAAESSENTSPSYTMLWRRVEPTGAFAEIGGHRSWEIHTNSNESERVRGIPGEFFMAELEPGTYALDGVFGLIRDGRVNYVAQGVIAGPQRPTFEVRAGEAIYLGIWQMDIVDASSSTRLWRLDSDDLRAVLTESNPVHGEVRLRETREGSVPCTPHRVNAMTTRQVC